MTNEVRRRAPETAGRIVFDRLAGHPARVYLFGSRARGDEDLEESTVPYFVDVVDLSTAGSKLRDAVKRESVEWYPLKAPEDPRPVSRA